MGRCYLRLVAALGVAAMGCSATPDIADDEGGGGQGAGTPSTGGAAAVGGAGGVGGTPNLCGTDCSVITTPQCFVSVCNEGQYPGGVGQCVVVPDDGTPCDDGQFCTTGDTCAAGVCEGGPPNDCGMQHGECDQVVCNEESDSCTLMPIPNGDPCTSDDLCVVGTTCQNGLCAGGSTKDCFFAPVPNECHVAVCNPSNGMCEPVPGNDGEACTDTSDLCTVGKTCSAGTCGGGGPKDCSHLTAGCNMGVCEQATGTCTTQAVGEGMTCDDLNACTSGEICSSGVCGGGTPVTQCVSGDFCCPAGCTEATDADCGCTINHALTATPSSSGGGSGQYGPSNWNDGVLQTTSCNQGWISNSSTPGSAWMQYEWPSARLLGSFFFDTNGCTDNCYTGRGLASAQVQVWDIQNQSWVTVGNITGQTGDFTYVFNPPVTTTKLRLYAVTSPTCGGGNTLAYEWYVWSGTACSP